MCFFVTQCTWTPKAFRCLKKGPFDAIFSEVRYELLWQALSGFFDIMTQSNAQASSGLVPNACGFIFNAYNAPEKERGAANTNK